MNDSMSSIDIFNEKLYLIEFIKNEDISIVYMIILLSFCGSHDHVWNDFVVSWYN